MAARIVALLIPLAITLPQLQTSGAGAAAPNEPARQIQQAGPPAWSYETRRTGDAAMTRVVLESPALDAIRTMPSGASELEPSQPGARKASVHGATLRSSRMASSARSATLKTAPTHRRLRHAKSKPIESGCEPRAHCAPVVVAKVTPVSRKSL